MVGHVFISYSHLRDGPYVDRLATHLTSAGFMVWYDREIIHGDRWTRVIQQQIDTCAAFIVVMTPDAAQSEWVENEVNQARLTNRPILPLLLEGQRFFALASVQYEDVRGGAMPGPAYMTRLGTLAPRRVDPTAVSPAAAADPPPAQTPIPLAPALRATASPQPAPPTRSRPSDILLPPVPERPVPARGGGFLDNVLYEGEVVRLHLHPHGRVMTLPTVWLVVSLLLPIGAIAFGWPIWLLGIVIVLAFAILVRFVIAPFVVWRSAHYVLTNSRILLRQGVLRREERNIELRLINDISVRQTFVERLLNTGSLTVESAGERGQTILLNVPSVIRVMNVLKDEVERDADSREPPPAHP